jgi:hypothetical protein
MEPSATPGWQINLAWGQKVAAYWSISWPAWVACYIMVVFLRHSVGTVSILARDLVFFGLQAVLTYRLVRKKYHSFRVDVIRDDGQRGPKLSMGEASLVWLWILGPQLALLLMASVLLWGYGAKLPPEAMGGISSWSLLLQILVVGPYAVGLALRAKYPGFRLQAYRHRA